MVIRCPGCGAENLDSAEFCSLCLSTFTLESTERAAFEPQDGVSFIGEPAHFDGEDVHQGENGNEFSAVSKPSIPLDSLFTLDNTGGLPHDASRQWIGREPSTGRIITEAYSAGFTWERALITCVRYASGAAAVSLVLELLLGFFALNAALHGDITLAYVWILLALLAPSCGAAFLAGNRMENYGWALGMITVALWAFVLRPLYLAILGWILTSSFHISSPFDRVVLVSNVVVFLPLGLFFGWLGEKRATTGLSI